MNRIVLGDNLDYLRSLPAAIAQLIYLDPPFNTGGEQRRLQTKTADDEQGDSVGFGGRRCRREVVASSSWPDAFGDYLGFLAPRLEEARRLLTATGSLFFHIDYREAHYCKILLDQIFGREAFVNEIIWAYDYGGRSKRRWPTKHDTIFWYAADPRRYTFNYEAIDRIPYLAPSLVGPTKAARGKTPTDVWWQTIVSPTGREKTGYPTQKPLAILERIVNVHSNPGDLVVDFFAGSGTTGVAAARHERRYLLIDSNPAAIEIMRQRLEWTNPEIVYAQNAGEGAGAAGTR